MTTIQISIPSWLSFIVCITAALCLFAEGFNLFAKAYLYLETAAIRREAVVRGSINKAFLRQRNLFLLATIIIGLAFSLVSWLIVLKGWIS